MQKKAVSVCDYGPLNTIHVADLTVELFRLNALNCTIDRLLERDNYFSAAAGNLCNLNRACTTVIAGRVRNGGMACDFLRRRGGVHRLRVFVDAISDPGRDARR